MATFNLAKALHAARHFVGGPDPIAPSDIGAADEEAGVPTGGTAGQVLSKISDTDLDLTWADGGGGGGGTAIVAGDNVTFVTNGDGATVISAADPASSFSALDGALAISQQLPGMCFVTFITTSNYTTVARPTTRTDETVLWVGSDDAHPPSHSLAGKDLWARPAT